MFLSELAMGAAATVLDVTDNAPNDVIAQRLRDLGFVAGEPVRLVARAPLGADPLLVQIGYTRFALRRAEAQRVRVTKDVGEPFVAPAPSDVREAVGRDESRPYKSKGAS